MLFYPDRWCEEFSKRLMESFSDKLIFVGLQGSYGRGEARESCDVDLVVVLDKLSPLELDLYAEAVASMPFSEKACGFICGQTEMRAWSEPEKFLLFHDTAPIYGSLDFIAPPCWDDAAACALKEGACAIYHGACHNRLYEKNMKILSELYKSTFFVMRVKHFLQSGRFVKRLSGLMLEVYDEDREILRIFLDFRAGKVQEKDVIALSDMLIKWSSEIIAASQ